MARDNGPGLFTMGFISSIEKLPVAEAKEVALKVVDESTAVDKNKTQARAMILKAPSTPKLMFGMTQFMLSHMGLKTIR